MALAVDWMSHIDYVLTVVNSKKGKGPSRPPTPIKRPGDVSTSADSIGTVNLETGEVIKGGSLTLEEMDRVIEIQTGRGGDDGD